MEAYRKRKAEVKEGIYFPQKRKRFALFKEVAQDFLNYSRTNKRSAHHDEQRMGYWLEVFGDRSAAAITPQDIERHKEALAQDRAPGTVNRYLALLKTTFSLAVSNGKLDKNPVKAVKLFKENNARIRYLLPEEEAKLMAALPSYFRPLATLALHTGLRRGELLSLQWPDINFETRTLTVRRSKHGEARHVPLNSVAYDTLMALKRARKVLAVHLFATESGGQLHKFGHIWVSAVKRAGFDDLHFQDLRHTFASRLGYAGYPLEDDPGAYGPQDHCHDLAL